MSRELTALPGSSADDVAMLHANDDDIIEPVFYSREQKMRRLVSQGKNESEALSPLDNFSRDEFRRADKIDRGLGGMKLPTCKLITEIGLSAVRLVEV